MKILEERERQPDRLAGRWINWSVLNTSTRDKQGTHMHTPSFPSVSIPHHPHTRSLPPSLPPSLPFSLPSFLTRITHSPYQLSWRELFRACWNSIILSSNYLSPPIAEIQVEVEVEVEVRWWIMKFSGTMDTSKRCLFSVSSQLKKRWRVKCLPITRGTRFVKRNQFTIDKLMMIGTISRLIHKHLSLLSLIIRH